MGWFDALGGYRPDGGLMRDPTGLQSGFRRPAPARVGADSAGRIAIVKGGDCVCLSLDELRAIVRRLEAADG